MPIWKPNFCSRILELSVVPWCRERRQTAICCLEGLASLKCIANCLDAFLSPFSRLEFVLGIGRLVICFADVILLAKSASYAADDNGWKAMQQVKWPVIFMDRLYPDIFSTLRMKGHVLHHARAHLKVPAWSLVWNALLTKSYLYLVAFEWN